jgi:hypothetical protein
MTSRVAVYTSATYTYFARARVLARTLKRIHPEWHMVLLIPDDPPQGVKIKWKDEPFDQVMGLSDLPIKHFGSWLFRHNVVELCTAIKGMALQQLQRQGYDKVFYIDPDIAVFSSLDGLSALLESSSILLTPHQISPELTTQGIEDNERASLKYGVYNLGFVGVASDETGARFADWWAERCYHYCVDDVPNGLFTDQRWCDLVPAYFDRVHVVRDPGYNVASWNLSRRKIRFGEDGAIYVNHDFPLRFFHFTKVDHVGETMLRRYAGTHLDAIELMYWYRRALRANDLPGVPARYWKYGTYSDGTQIEQSARVAYRQLADAEDRFPDPFRVGAGAFKEWLTQRESESSSLEEAT